MVSNVLENVARWNIQIALLTIVAAVLLRVLAVSAPAVRHAIWRTLLVVCLALPVVQPWRAPAIDTSQVRAEIVDAALLTAPTAEMAFVAGPSAGTRLARHLRSTWTAYVGMVLAAGVAVRLAWLLAGIWRLQRLRRTGALAVTSEGYRELAALIEAGAEIRRVERLGQPVTFGVLKPAVLLPASFHTLPEGVQRAVLAHELWHVRRRDWAWVLLEEAIRAAFWFNPAMWWLVSRVQSSREEVVDELTVQVTNARKTYLEALLAFADQPTLFPATPFARRRHLFHRMLLISREAVMSSRRIVASTLATAAVLLATGLYASSAFPLKAAPVATVASAEQAPPRDRRPGEAGPETARERELKAAIAAGAVKAPQVIELARLQEARGATAEAEATLQAFAGAAPTDRDAMMALAAHYNRTGQFDRTVATLETVAAMTPTDPQGYHLIATFYWEKAFKDPRLSPAQKTAYIDAGISATDRALGYDPDYADALTYKNILLRMKANAEADPAIRQTLRRRSRCVAQPRDGVAEDPPERPFQHGLRAGARSTASPAAAAPSPRRAHRRSGASQGGREHQAADKDEGRQACLPR